MTDSKVVQLTDFDRLIEIACTSRNAVAKRFKRWLFREVLPEIRRTRRYEGNTAPLDAWINEIDNGRGGHVD